jgi:hypothetical protein
MNNRKISHLRGSEAAQNARNAALASGNFSGFLVSVFTAPMAGFEGVSGSLRRGNAMLGQSEGGAPEKARRSRALDQPMAGRANGYSKKPGGGRALLSWE